MILIAPLCAGLFAKLKLTFPVKNLLLIVCLLSNNIFAQTFSTVDSLLENTNVDDSSQIYQAVKALNLSKELEYQKGEARSYHVLGYMYSVKKNYPKAMEKYFQARQKFKEIGDKNREALVCVSLAYAFHALKDYEKEKQYCRDVLMLSTVDSTRAYAYNSIGRAEMAEGNVKRAVASFNRAIIIMDNNGLTHKIYKFYTNLGVSYQKVHMYDSAIMTFWKIDRYAYKRPDVLAQMYMNIGVSYHLKGDYDNAELNYLESISMGNKDCSGKSCLNYAELLHQMGEKNKAKQYLAHGLTYDYDLGHLGRTLFAMEMFKESAQVRDSLFNHATKDYEQLMKTSVNIATVESDLRNAREKAALKEIAEYKSKWMWAVAGISFLLLAMAGKYLWDCRHKIQSFRDFKSGLLADVRKIKSEIQD